MRIRMLLLLLGCARAVVTIADEPGRWAFEPIQPVHPPSTKNNRGINNPIDSFILATLDRVGLKPSPQASRLTLLRRASFDLTGLPPTPEQIASFLKDKRPEA